MLTLFKRTLMLFSVFVMLFLVSCGTVTGGNTGTTATVTDNTTTANNTTTAPASDSKPAETTAGETPPDTVSLPSVNDFKSIVYIGDTLGGIVSKGQTACEVMELVGIPKEIKHSNPLMSSVNSWDCLFETSEGYQVIVRFNIMTTQFARSENAADYRIYFKDDNVGYHFNDEGTDPEFVPCGLFNGCMFTFGAT